MSRYSQEPARSSSATRGVFPPENAPAAAAPAPAAPAWDAPAAVRLSTSARSTTRGVPMLSAPRFDNDPLRAGGPVPIFGGAGGYSVGPPRAHTNVDPSAGATAAAPSVAPSAMAHSTYGVEPVELNVAMRARERRLVEPAPPVGPPPGGVARDLASRGIAGSYDPTAASAAPASTVPAQESRTSRDAATRLGAGAGARAAVSEAAGGSMAAVPSASTHDPAAEADSSSPSADANDLTTGSVENSPEIDSLVMPLSGPAVDAAGASSDWETSVLPITDMRAFLTQPTPKSAGIVQCYIEREKSSIFSPFSYPVYTLRLKEGDTFLLAGRKRMKNKTSNYVITMDKRDLARDSPAFIGKLRSNFLGTDFTLFDDGEASEALGASAGAGSLRQELAVVNFASNVLSSRGPRKMKVATPLITDKPAVFQPDKDEESMMNMFKQGLTQNMFLMINKPPKWNEHVGAYVLNFNGRVTMASVKNFQLVSPNDHDTVVLQFGRVAKDTFNMDYQWPLTPLQAFAITLSAFDYKLSVE